MYAPWFDRWGPVATPLFWSHAMYLIMESGRRRVSELLPTKATFAPDEPIEIEVRGSGGPESLSLMRLDADGRDR